MKCHYEILEVSRDAELAEIKSAYRKFALKWHPDKNLDNTEHAKEQFQLVQQAYEVLSDPQERAWYDKHREQILRGSNSEFEDNSLDVFQYFTATCFKGYGDDDKGFYTVYRNVFDQIIEEDLEFMDDKDELSDVPRFGDSQSDYDEVVGSFYAYWSSYCTKKSYVWLDPYDIKEIRDRRVFKAAEKENKKVRMKAKKERNEEVRNLVAFVRKRDKRVQENAKRLEAKILENRQKQEELSKQRRMERKKQLNESGAQAEWTKFDNVKSELEEIEKNLAQEFGEELSNSEEEFEENSDLYCVACNKIFKTVKALENHESSKKHRENVEKLKASMIEEEEDLAQEFDEERSNFEEESEESSGLYCMTCNKIFKTVKALENHESSKKHKENVEKLKAIMIEEEEEDLAQEFDEERANSEEESEESSVLYCMTCNKIFKTVKALENHESSKKHRENVEKLKPSMIEEEEGSEIVDDEYLSEEESENSRDRTEKQNRKNENNHAVTGDEVDLSDEESEESIEQIKKRKKKNKKAKNVLPLHRDEEEEVDVIKIVNSDEDFNFECTKKQKKRNKRQNKNMNTTQETENVEKNTKTNKNRKQQKKERKDVTIEEIDTSHCCVTCKSNFPSKNKLFDHLKKTGHGVHIPKKSKNVK